MRVTRVAIDGTSFINQGSKRLDSWVYQEPRSKRILHGVRLSGSRLIANYIRYNWDRLTQADYDGYRRRINIRCKNLRLRN